jgi:signal transduction histidine kinase
VTNEGPKIPEEVQRRMFDPYFKVPSTDADNASETAGYLGLGLTIVKEVTEAHGGKIEYEPLEPRGSCFRVLLPLKTSEKI